MVARKNMASILMELFPGKGLSGSAAVGSGNNP